MRKLITVFILMLLVTAGCFAKERIEYFGNFAILYDTESTQENYDCTKEEVIDELKSLNSDFQEKTVFGVFLTEEDIDICRRLGSLNKALVKEGEFRTKRKTSDIGKAMYRAEELALHGIWGVQVWVKCQGDNWVRIAFVFFKASEDYGIGVKYFTILCKSVEK